MIDSIICNVVLLIDVDNVLLVMFDFVLMVLVEFGIVNVWCVYGNWLKFVLKGWCDMLIKYGIELQQQFDLIKGKNVIDMKMMIDVMDLFYCGCIDGFGIMLLDSDFMLFVMCICQDGVLVYGFGISCIFEGFCQVCICFIDVSVFDEMMELMLFQLLFLIGGEKVMVLVLVLCCVKGGELIGFDLIKLLIDVYNVGKCDEKGYQSFIEFGQCVGNCLSFDVCNYGYNQLFDLIEVVLNFQIECCDGGWIFVKWV